MVDFTYDGTTLTWVTNGNKKYKATSGIPHGQKAGLQLMPDFGPVPSGLYTVSIVDNGEAQIETTAGGSQLKAASGVQKIPENFPQHEAWGTWRVRIDLKKPDNPAARARSGFYIHDSTKGYSHGCIETQHSFFSDVDQYKKTPEGRKRWLLTLQVKYSSEITNGGTGIPKQGGGLIWNADKERQYHDQHPEIGPRDDPFNEHSPNYNR